MQVVNEAFIHALAAAPKRVLGLPVWKKPTMKRDKDGRERSPDHYEFEVQVVADGFEGSLLWRGWRRCDDKPRQSPKKGPKTGRCRWGFSLIYDRRYVVRSFDFGKVHDDKVLGRVRLFGRHMHFYRDEDDPAAILVMDAGLISTEDVRQATEDFARVLNIAFPAKAQVELF